MTEFGEASVLGGLSSGSSGRATVNRATPSTVAGFPVEPVWVECDSLRLPLLVVQHLEAYVDTQRLLRDQHAPEPPYWAHVWPGSRYLARLMANTPCTGRRVVDIGCGLGLAGIVAGLRGAAATLVDTAGEGLQLARANATLNGLIPDHCGRAENGSGRGRVTVVQTDVRRPGLRGRFDCVLAADVTYDPALQRALAIFVAEHLAPYGRAWCAESVRTFDQGFRQTCEAQGLRVTESVVRERDEEREVPVRLTEVCW